MISDPKINTFLRTIIDSLISVDTVFEGIVLNSALYFIKENTVLYQFDLSSFIPNNIYCIFDNISYKSNIDYILDIDTAFANITSCRVSQIVMNYNSYINPNNLIYENNNFNLEYPEYTQLKKSDGAKKFFVNEIKKDINIPIFIFTSLIKLNKSDKLGIKVYKMSEQFSMIVFDIYKSKFKLNYTMTMRILNFI